MLFFKLDPDAQHLQFADRRQTLCGIPGEAGDGFTEDLVNQSSAAIRHETLEVLAFFYRCTGDTSVRIDIDHGPVLLA